MLTSPHAVQNMSESNVSQYSTNEEGEKVASVAPRSDRNGETGHIRVYHYSTTDEYWVQRGDDIDGEAGDYSGWTVDISAEGTVVSIGSPYSDEQKIMQGVFASKNLIL